MLVLLSFGLVLVAAVLVVLGVTDDGLVLVYASIGASLAAAVVLLVALKISKPTEQPASAGPSTMPPEAPAPSAPPPIDQQWPAPATGGPDAGHETTGGDGVEFPIADYDELRVSELLPLLPELYADELDVVEERERATKGRSTVLNALSDLRAEAVGTDRGVHIAASTEPVEWEVDEDDAVDEAPGTEVPTTEPFPAVDPALVVEPAGTAEPFPILDYDELTAREINSVLDQLEDDELHRVQAHERSGRDRVTVHREIDRLLGIPTSRAKRSVAKKAPAKKAPANGSAKKGAAKGDTARRG